MCKQKIITTTKRKKRNLKKGKFNKNVIFRGYDDQSYNSPVISSRQVQRPGGPAVQNAQSKVLMIRRADGTTQFLRPVNGANGSAAGIQRPVMAGNPGPCVSETKLKKWLAFLDQILWKLLTEASLEESSRLLNDLEV